MFISAAPFWPRLHACRASMVRPRPRSSTCSWAAAPFGGAALAPLVRGGCASLWRCVAWTVSCRCASMARLRISPRTAAPLGCCVAPAPWRLHPSGGAASEPLDPRTAAPPLGAASRPRLGGCTLRAVLRFLPCASCHAVLALRFQPCASCLALPALRFSDSLARLTSSGLRRGCRGVCCVVCVLCVGSSWRTSELLEFCVASRSVDLFEVCIERRTRPARLSSSSSASGSPVARGCLLAAPLGRASGRAFSGRACVAAPSWAAPPLAAPSLAAPLAALACS
jgi:hypothetical protein